MDINLLKISEREKKILRDITSISLPDSNKKAVKGFKLDNQQSLGLFCRLSPNLNKLSRQELDYLFKRKDNLNECLVTVFKYNNKPVI